MLFGGSMNFDVFSKLVDNLSTEEQDILRRKGEEYRCGNPDVLANFKRQAQLLDIPPEKIWAVYFLKHIDAIINYVRSGRIVSDEPIQGRIADARNYLLLGHALFTENQPSS